MKDSIKKLKIGIQSENWGASILLSSSPLITPLSLLLLQARSRSIFSFFLWSFTTKNPRAREWQGQRMVSVGGRLRDRVILCSTCQTPELHGGSWHFSRNDRCPWKQGRETERAECKRIERSQSSVRCKRSRRSPLPLLDENSPIIFLFPHSLLGRQWPSYRRKEIQSCPFPPSFSSHSVSAWEHNFPQWCADCHSSFSSQLKFNSYVAQWSFFSLFVISANIVTCQGPFQWWEIVSYLEVRSSFLISKIQVLMLCCSVSAPFSQHEKIR